MDNERSAESDTNESGTVQPPVATKETIERAGPVWENRGSLNVATAFFRTMSSVLIRPRGTFATARVSMAIGSAFVFCLVPNLVSVAIATAIQGWVSELMASFMPPGAAQPAGSNAGFSLAMVVAMPFVGAGVTHLLLVVANGRKYGYGATFRVGAYVSGSVALFGWVPCVGWLGSFVWTIVANIIGLASIHETSRGKAAFAVIGTIALVATVFIVGYFVGMAMGYIEAPTPPTQV